MKKILFGFFLCGFSLFLLTAILTYLAFSSQTKIESPSALLITLDGPIIESETNSLEAYLSQSPSVSMTMLTGAIREAAKDNRISGIVLNIINPQIGMAQIQEIEAAMSHFRASEKWSLAFMESAGVQSSGNAIYALTLCADKVYLAPPGSLNIVGLRSQSPFLGGLFEKLGIEPFFGKRKDYKSGPDIFTRKDFSPTHEQQLKEVLDDIQNSLRDHIASRRDVNLETAQTWISNGPYTPTQAKAKGLIDEIAYYDSILDQIKERTGRNKALISIQQYAHSLMPTMGNKTIAVITAAGTIHRGSSDNDPLASKSSIGSTTYTKAFRKARQDKVSGVLFRIDSGGGSYIASDLIRREVELTKNAGIPVVVSMGNYAASGGYFIAMDANHIVAQPSTITGSIGVYSGSFATRDFFEKHLGITFDSYNAASNADIFDSMDSPSPKQQELLKTTLDRIYDDFVNKMARARNKTPQQAEAAAQGRIWSGNQALTNGLIDELGGLEVALRKLKALAEIAPNEPLLFQTYPAPDNPLAIARKALSSGVSISAALSSGFESIRAITQRTEDAALQAPPLQFHQE